MRHKASRLKYEQMFAAVAEVINAWDAYCLLEGGAPSDEFHPEIARIVAQVPKIRSKEDAALVVSRVFSEMFDPEEFSEDKCRDVGHSLFKHLKERGFITDAPLTSRSSRPASKGTDG